MNITAIEKARGAWGDDIPNWVVKLAEEIDASSQNQVAKSLDRSPTLVSYVIRNRYTGDMIAVEQRVRAIFMEETMVCPALGEIGANECQDWRSEAAKGFSPLNSKRTRMFLACNACPIAHREEG